MQKFFRDVKTLDQKPTVLISGDTGFIGFYLRELLLFKNCQVIAEDKVLPEKIKKVDYVFCLTGKKIEKIKASLKTAEKFGARLLLAIHQNNTAEKTIKNLLGTKKVDWRIVRLGFVYGPRMNLEVEDEVTSLIRDAVIGGPLRISGSGSKKVYPTFVSDVVYGLSKAMFSSGTEGKIFSLVSPEGMTLLSLAQLLKDKSQKSLTIEFVPEGGEHLLGEPTNSDHLEGEAEKSQSDLGWQAKTKIEEGLEQTVKYFEKEVRVEGGGRKKLKHPFSLLTSRLAPHFSHLILILLLFLIILSLPLLSLLFDGFWGVRNLKAAQQALLEVDFDRAAKQARVSQESFSRANRKIQRFSFFFNSLGLEKSSSQLEKLLTVGDKLAESIIHAGWVAQSTTELAKVVFQNQQGDIKNLLAKIKTELDFTYDQVSLAEAEVETEENLLPIDIPFTGIRGLLLQAREGIEIIPEIIGISGKRVYLVLLQNNMELRPTGGFIGSYALVTFNEGQLLDFEVRDVYTADGQLKGHVEPPADLKKYLGEAGWYLRDSNWDPDFPSSALRAEWFLEKETGRTVDGVFGVDLFLAQNILEQIGEVEVFDFGERINHRNLFERAEYYSEAGFFPGSTQKKDFLASLTRALFEKIESSEEKIWLSLARAIRQSADEKDLLVYLHDPQAMKIVTDLGWSGGIKNVTCYMLHVTCYLDYLMIVEANVGVNKANYFVNRNLTHQVKIDQEGTVQETLQIQYQNQSQSESFPAGRYKSYVRVYVPLKSELIKLVVKDPQTGRSEEVGNEKWEIKEEHGKTVFGFLVEVPIQEERIVEISYQLVEKIDFSSQTQYLFLLQKQPGIRDKDFNFWLTAPEGISLVKLKPSAVQSANTLLFNPEFNQDIVFEVRLVR